MDGMFVIGFTVVPKWRNNKVHIEFGAETLLISGI